MDVFLLSGKCLCVCGCWRLEQVPGCLSFTRFRSGESSALCTFTELLRRCWRVVRFGNNDFGNLFSLLQVNWRQSFDVFIGDLIKGN
jgi:hypothetical protein